MATYFSRNYNHPMTPTQNSNPKTDQQEKDLQQRKDLQTLLERTCLEMRWRCLSLAADLDRLQRSLGNSPELQSDPRLTKIQQAIAILSQPSHPAPNRAEQVQMIFSDQTSPPNYRAGSRI